MEKIIELMMKDFEIARNELLISSHEVEWESAGYYMSVALNRHNMVTAYIENERCQARFQTVADERGLIQAVAWLYDMRG